MKYLLKNRSICVKFEWKFLKMSRSYFLHFLLLLFYIYIYPLAHGIDNLLNNISGCSVGVVSNVFFTLTVRLSKLSYLFYSSFTSWFNFPNTVKTILTRIVVTASCNNVNWHNLHYCKKPWPQSYVNQCYHS